MNLDDKDLVGPCLLAGAVTAGTFKALGLPGPDLTIVLGTLIVAWAILCSLQLGGRIPYPGPYVIALVLLLLIPMAPASASPYSRDKVIGIVLTCVLVVVAPIVIRNGSALHVFLVSLVVLALLATAMAYIGFGSLLAGRVGLGSGNPLLLAKTLALGMISAGMLVARGGWSLWRGLLVLAVCAPLLLQTQMRAPLLVGVGGFLGAIVWRQRHRRVGPATRARAFLSRRGFAAAICALVLSAIYLAAARGTGRISSLMGRGDFFESTARTSELERALGVPPSVLGAGWGHYQSQVQTDFLYPHNILAEFWIEAGFLGLFLLVVLCMLAIAWCLRSPNFSVLALLIVSLLGFALVSGDVNGNRSLFVILAVAATLRRFGHEEANVGRLDPAWAHPRSREGT